MFVVFAGLLIASLLSDALLRCLATTCGHKEQRYKYMYAQRGMSFRSLLARTSSALPACYGSAEDAS